MWTSMTTLTANSPNRGECNTIYTALLNQNSHACQLTPVITYAKCYWTLDTMQH